MTTLICAGTHEEAEAFLKKNKLNGVIISNYKQLFEFRDAKMIFCGNFKEREDLHEILIHCKIRNIYRTKG